MITVILAIHLILTIALIGVVLLQKSEGGALGMGGGGMSGFMTGRSTANLLTRTTAALAVLFFFTSITLAWMAGSMRAPHSVIDTGTPASAPPGSESTPTQPAPTSPAPAGGQPAPAEPSAPLAK